MATVDLEAKMTIQKLHETDCSKAHIADLLGVSEGTVRYHVKRIESGAHGGRAGKVRFAVPYAEAIDYWHHRVGEGPINMADLHASQVVSLSPPFDAHRSKARSKIPHHDQLAELRAQLLELRYIWCSTKYCPPFPSLTVMFESHKQRLKRLR